MINLITSFFLPEQLSRREEIIKTLKKNLYCPYISKIHLFLDNEECKLYLDQNITPLDEKIKIKIIEIGKQPTYKDLFEYANSLLNQLCMIANSDIWLYGIKNNLYLNLLKRHKIIYSLTRHDYDLKPREINNFAGGHDAFIFKSPINKELLPQMDVNQNWWGSEHLINLLLDGYARIFNPCQDIIIIHEHKSPARDSNRTDIWHKVHKILRDRQEIAKSEKKPRPYMIKHIPCKIKIINKSIKFVPL